MGFIIHEALFGQDREHGQGYELLGTTHPDKTLVKRMGNSTDLGENVPSNISWQPALRGRIWNGFYLLFKTYPDTSSDVRRGRVFSHVFLIEEQHLGQLINLQPLLSKFSDQLNKSLELSAMEYLDEKLVKLTFSPRLGALLKELLNPSRSGPIMWAGQEEFEQAANLMWQVLSSEERKEFIINIGFMPNQVHNPAQKYQLIAVPEIMLQRWRRIFFVLELDANHTFLNEAEAYLLGDISKAQNLHKLVLDLGNKPNKIDHYDTLQKVASIANNLSMASLQETITLLLTLYWYKPAKSELITRTIHHLLFLIKISDAENLNRLGAITKEKIAEQTLMQIENAISERLVDLYKEDFRKAANTLLAWPNEPARSWWRRSMRIGWQSILANWKHSSTLLTLLLIEQPAEMVSDYLELLPDSSQVENNLVNAFKSPQSKLSVTNGITLSKERDWFKLHMICLLKVHSVLEALQKQLKIDTETAHTEALHLAAEQSKDTEFIEAVVIIRENRLVELAAKLCVQKPALFQRIDTSKLGWQEVWVASAKISNKLWSGIDQPARLTISLLNQLVDGKEVSNELLYLISESEYADIRKSSIRVQVWPVLQDNSRDNFLRKTALGVVQNENPEEIQNTYEPELVSIFSKPDFISQVFRDLDIPLGKAIKYINRFSLLESTLITYMQSLGRMPNVLDAIVLGRLIHQKQWTNAAEKVYDMVSSNRLPKEALAECVEHLGLLKSFKAHIKFDLSNSLSYSQLTDKWWNLLADELKQVYYQGPCQNNLWEESGGKNHEIKSSLSGGDQWNDALWKLKNGQSRNNIKTLLSIVIDQTPFNEIFKTLGQNISYA